MGCLFLCYIYEQKIKFYQFQLFSAKNFDIFRNFKENWEENTKNLSNKLKAREGFPTPEVPCDVIKKPALIMLRFLFLSERWS